MNAAPVRTTPVQTTSDPPSDGRAQPGPVIEVQGLRTQFGTQVIHDGLDFQVELGEIMGVVGGSGSGKSVLLRTIVGLIRPAAGRVCVLGHDTGRLRAADLRVMQRRTGVLFQDGALFSSLTVEQNIEVPLKEHTRLSPRLRRQIAELKIGLVGLPPDSANKYPAQLSGGMRKRAGLARALALDPEILFLDEPTAGLDPIGANKFDGLILKLSQALGLTVVMITHDLDSLHAICDRVSVLIDKRVKVGTIDELMRLPDAWIQDYFMGPRGRAALASGGQRPRERSGEPVDMGLTMAAPPNAGGERKDA
jgi:phospholipid/cholesterol/gamma-HCH transport system ATP-binding protein